MVRILIITLLTVQLLAQVAPPTWPEAFHQVFVETYPNSQLHISGRYYYDSVKNATREDRVDGSLDRFCKSVLPNVTTPCTHLAIDGKRWLVYPQKKFCCFCCDAAHGCGILRRDWLKTSTYVGNESLSGETFYKWSIPDGSELDYYYAKQTEERVPRRIISGSASTQDFIMNTYTVESINATIFTVPDYCKNTCPSTSVCSRFQSTKLEQY